MTTFGDGRFESTSRAPATFNVAGNRVALSFAPLNKSQGPIIDMLAMWHRLVPTIGAVPVNTLVTAAIVVGCAAFRVFCTYFQDMFFNKRRAGGANRVYLRRNVR
jgi:hypothetical protein